MSVFKRSDRNTPHYVFEFQYRGRTFKGTTGCTNKQEALAFEREERKRAAEEYALEQKDPARLTVEDVFGRYWETHGCTLSWAPTLKDHMIALENFLGPNKPFMDVTKADLSAALDDYAATEGRRNVNGDVSPSKSSKNG